MHFEDLWTQSEESFKEELNDSLEDIVARLVIKLNTLKSLGTQVTNSADDLVKIKIHLMGEILLDLSHISVKDNIDVYQAMQTALHYKKIGFSLLNHQDS